MALTGTAYGMANPASITGREALSLAFAASRSFGLGQLDHLLTTGTVGTRLGNAALVIESFGFEAYRRLTGHLLIAGSVRSQTISAGARMSYSHLTIRGFGSRGLGRLSLGVRAAVGARVSIGMMVENIARSRSDTAEGGRRIAVGVMIVPADFVILVADVEQAEQFLPALHAGTEIEVFDRVTLRGGFSTFPATFSFGIGIRVAAIGADLAAARHQPLGWSNSVGMVIRP